MDTYPRFDVRAYLDPRDDEGHRIAHRVSAKRVAVLQAQSEASRGDDFWAMEAREVARPRFRIKIAKWPTNWPVILKDSHRRAFHGRYRTLEAACRAMDNTIRRERGMPERFDWARGDVHVPSITEAHTGQHLQGCVSCHVYLDDARKGAAERAGR